jgi:NADH-quinone oxidoreductase subunit C
VKVVWGVSVSDKIEFLSRYAIRTELVKPARRVFVVEPETVRKLFEEFIKQYGYESFYISTIVGTDFPSENKVRLDYYVVLLPEEENIVVRTFLERSNPVISTLVDIIPGVLSGECETHDLLGVVFKGNPFLRRGFFVATDIAEKDIYPLRKDSGA